MMEDNRNHSAAFSAGERKVLTPFRFSQFPTNNQAKLHKVQGVKAKSSEFKQLLQQAETLTGRSDTSFFTLAVLSQGREGNLQTL